MASISYRKERDRWEVRWREPVVTVDGQGREVTEWKWRKRSAKSKKDAERLLLEVQKASTVGERWQDERKTAVATVGVAVTAYIMASTRGRPEATAKFRASVMQKWLDWAGEERTVDTLTTGLLSEYAEHLHKDGLSSVSRYVGLVEQWWRWAYNRADTYPGIPTPRRITGSDNDIPHRQAPVAVDTPTWAEVDAMLFALTPAGGGKGKGFGYRPQWALSRRIALFQRFTGLRISQIVNMTWADVDMEQHRLVIRAGTVGSKGQRHHRVVPLHAELAEEMAGWGVREGPVFVRIATKGKKKGQAVIPRGSEVAEVFTGAWKRAEVPEKKWGATGGREKARPTNAIRARWKSTIAGAAGYELATMMVGQSTRSEHDSYVAMGNPEASPYWSMMVRALDAVPGVEEEAPDEREVRGKVRRLRREER